MSGTLTFDELKAKQRASREGFPETVGLRVHRALSWIGRAEQCDADPDAQFIFLWIAFNATYADECGLQAAARGERDAFSGFFEKLVAIDSEDRIYGAIWQRFSGPVRALMSNKFVFSPFWHHQNGVEGYEDWHAMFANSAQSFAKAFSASDTARVLSFVFDRLYVLRNQLVHGGATWNSRVNRNQVADGARILGFLLPVFVDLMMDSPDESWGRPFYPVVE